MLFHDDLPRTNRLPAHVNSLLTEESVMSFIAWIVPGSAADTITTMLHRTAHQ
jgi:hypothetical protein